jgi:hypothetical protein
MATYKDTKFRNAAYDKISDWFEDVQEKDSFSEDLHLFELAKGSKDPVSVEGKDYYAGYPDLAKKTYKGVCTRFYSKPYKNIKKDWQIGGEDAHKDPVFTYGDELSWTLAVLEFLKQDEREINESMRERMPLAHLFGQKLWVAGGTRRNFRNIVMAEKKPNFLPDDSSLDQLMAAYKAYDKVVEDDRFTEHYSIDGGLGMRRSFVVGGVVGGGLTDKVSNKYFSICLTAYLWRVFSRELRGKDMDAFTRVMNTRVNESSESSTVYGDVHRVLSLVSSREMKYALENEDFSNVKGQIVKLKELKKRLLEQSQFDLKTVYKVLDVIEHTSEHKIERIIKRNIKYLDRNDDVKYILPEENLDKILDFYSPRIKAYLILTFRPWVEYLTHYRILSIVIAKFVDSLEKSAKNLDTEVLA